MEMEQWIEQRMEKIKESFGDRLHNYEYEWLASMFDSAWNRGFTKGEDHAYNNVSKWRREETK